MAEGFVVMKEAVVFNYWHLASANKTKLWTLHQVFVKSGQVS